MYSIDKNEGFPVLRTYPVRVSLHAGTRQKYCAHMQQKILSNTDVVMDTQLWIHYYGYAIMDTQLWIRNYGCVTLLWIRNVKMCQHSLYGGVI